MTGAGGEPHSSSTKTVRRLATAVRVLVSIACLLTIVLVVWFARRPTSLSGDSTFDRSVAILPFAFASDDTASAYLAEGIAEEVHTTLSVIADLRLAGRRSAARYANGQRAVQEIGSALNVSAVLEGTMRRSRDRVNVTAQLVNAHDGVVLWSQKYDRDARVLYTVQDDIARAIAGQMQVTLPDAATGAMARGTRDVAAYDLYLRGTYLARRGGDSVPRAIALLEQAVARDSSFARAWDLLALAYARGGMPDSAKAVTRRRLMKAPAVSSPPP